MPRMFLSKSVVQNFYDFCNVMYSFISFGSPSLPSNPPTLFLLVILPIIASPLEDAENTHDVLKIIACLFVICLICGNFRHQHPVIRGTDSIVLPAMLEIRNTIENILLWPSLDGDEGDAAMGNSVVSCVISKLTNDKIELCSTKMGNEGCPYELSISFSFRMCMANVLISACQKMPNSGKKTFAWKVLPHLIQSMGSIFDVPTICEIGIIGFSTLNSTANIALRRPIFLYYTAYQLDTAWNALAGYWGRLKPAAAFLEINLVCRKQKMVIVLHGLPRITCFTCLPGSSAGSCLHLLPQGKPKLFKCTSRRKIGRALYLKCLKGHCGDSVLLLKWRGIKTGRCEGICCDCRLMAFSSEDQSGDFFRRFIDYAVVTFERLYITKHHAIICLTLITSFAAKKLSHPCFPHLQSSASVVVGQHGLSMTNRDLRNAGLSSETAEEADARTVSCSYFCSKNKDTSSFTSVEENADKIQVSVLLRGSVKSPKFAASIAEYFPGLKEAKLLVEDCKFSVILRRIFHWRRQFQI
ncbi:hypothetical protein Vadar_010136 [Vaccinium darrowii]|uniref:Uncharacterized protein n=1 Tax=Vaccinium darrowii TaxID=229202 RepID=A0ACB7YL49_9ERIC|nr:hypothetical protein Vadar_010136 [Vaccinium darrowii]